MIEFYKNAGVEQEFGFSSKRTPKTKNTIAVDSAGKAIKEPFKAFYQGLIYTSKDRKKFGVQLRHLPYFAGMFKTYKNLDTGIVKEVVHTSDTSIMLTPQQAEKREDLKDFYKDFYSKEENKGKKIPDIHHNRLNDAGQQETVELREIEVHGKLVRRYVKVRKGVKFYLTPISSNTGYFIEPRTKVNKETGETETMPHNYVRNPDDPNDTKWYTETENPVSVYTPARWYGHIIQGTWRKEGKEDYVGEIAILTTTKVAGFQYAQFSDAGHLRVWTRPGFEYTGALSEMVESSVPGDRIRVNLSTEIADEVSFNAGTEEVTVKAEDGFIAFKLNEPFYFKKAKSRKAKKQGQPKIANTLKKVTLKSNDK